MIQRFILTAIILVSMSEISTAATARKFNMIPGPPPDLAMLLAYSCRKKNATCVIDFTSRISCSLKAEDYEPPNRDIDAELDQFSLKCPAYHWKKMGNVYVIEPRLKSDSILNVQIKSIHLTASIRQLMKILDSASDLQRPRGFGDMGLVSAGGPARSPPPQISFTLPAGTLKNSLITAAKQAPDTYWVVHYGARNELEFVAR